MIRSFPTTLMQDPVFRLRTPDARLVLFTLWMHPSNHLSGLFVLDLDHLALDVRLPLERSTPALRELTDHGLVLRHAPLDQLWLPRMAALLGNLGNGDAPVHKAVSKYVHGLVPSTLCHRVLDSLSIPYRNAADLPELCAWLPTDGCSVPQVTPSDTLSTRVPDRVLSVSVSVSGSGSGSGTGSEKITSGVAAQPDVAPPSKRAAEKAAAREAAKLAREAEKAAKAQAKQEAQERRARERAEAKEAGATVLRSHGSTLFLSYRDAFLRRYHTEPLRDAKTNAHFARIAKRTVEGRPADVSREDAILEASRVCSAYLRASMPQYLQSNHAPGMLEKDWHKLLTEHRTGRPITPQLARRSDADTKREEANQRFFERFDEKLAAIAPVPTKSPPEREPTRDELEELFRQ
jgi:hypothetical protein